MVKGRPARNRFAHTAGMEKRIIVLGRKKIFEDAAGVLRKRRKQRESHASQPALVAVDSAVADTLVSWGRICLERGTVLMMA